MPLVLILGKKILAGFVVMIEVFIWLFIEGCFVAVVFVGDILLMVFLSADIAWGHAILEAAIIVEPK